MITDCPRDRKITTIRHRFHSARRVNRTDSVLLLFFSFFLLFFLFFFCFFFSFFIPFFIYGNRGWSVNGATHYLPARRINHPRPRPWNVFHDPAVQYRSLLFPGVSSPGVDCDRSADHETEFPLGRFSLYGVVGNRR